MKLSFVKPKKAKIVFNGKKGLVNYEQSKITGNLAVEGTLDGQRLAAHITRGPSKATLGGIIIECEAIKLKETKELAATLAKACKWYSFHKKK